MANHRQDLRVDLTSLVKKMFLVNALLTSGVDLINRQPNDLGDKIISSPLSLFSIRLGISGVIQL